MPRKFLADYFSFTKKERTGVVTLLILIIIFAALPFFYPLFISHKKYDSAAFEKQIAELEVSADSTKEFSYADKTGKTYEHNYSFEKKEYNNPFKGAMFEFDPNTISADQWKQLGIRDKTIATIQNYLNKGGKFYKPEDISKIWGLHPYEIQRLTPYIKIAGKENFSKTEKPVFEKTIYKKESKVIDINLADSIAFVDLPGIGPGFAKRILNFRNRLGGFVSLNQIAETYGLPDSTFQKIKSRLVFNQSLIKQININTATLEELKTHPYIRYVIANAIIQYRTQHGSFSSINDLKKIMLITDEIFNKASPYVKIE